MTRRRALGAFLAASAACVFTFAICRAAPAPAPPADAQQEFQAPPPPPNLMGMPGYSSAAPPPKEMKHARPSSPLSEEEQDSYEDSEDTSAVHDDVVRQAREIFVPAGVLFKVPDPSQGVDSDTSYRLGESFFYGAKQKALDRMLDRFVGIRVPGDGVFVADALGYYWSNIESAHVILPDGSRAPAHPIGVSRHGRLVWFQSDALRGPLPPLSTGQLIVTPEPQDGDMYYSARVHEREDQGLIIDAWHSGISTANLLRPVSGQALLDYSEDLDQAFFDPDGNWLGVSRHYDSLEPDGTLLVHPDALARDRISWDALNAAFDKAGRALLERLPTVRLRFRQEKSAREVQYSFGDEDKAVKERADWGLPAGSGLVFVPAGLDADLVRRLESVSVEAGGREIQGRFVGVLRALRGYLIAVPRDLPGFDRRVAVPPDEEIFLAHDVSYRGGRIRHVRHVEYFHGTKYTYKDQVSRKPALAQRPDAIYSTLDGEPFGVMLQQNRYEAEHPEQEAGLEDSGPPTRFYTFSELGELLRSTATAVEPFIQPVEVAQAKRRPWLGVETQGITPDLAEALDLRTETEDGTRGRLIVLVYPGSPASKLGLKPGDVILQFRRKEKDESMVVPSKPAEGGPGAREEDVDDEESSRWWTSWFDRKNPLTNILAQLNTGASVVMTYASSHTVRTADLALEEGPPDFESAPKLDDEPTGLTLKDLTYDVRKVLKLEDIRGVLVYDVDSGSPADLANIEAMDIVLEANGSAVADAKSLVGVLERARAAGKKTVRLRLRYWNDTRYTDLSLAPKSPKSLIGEGGAEPEPEKEPPEGEPPEEQQ